MAFPYSLYFNVSGKTVTAVTEQRVTVSPALSFRIPEGVIHCVDLAVAIGGLFELTDEHSEIRRFQRPGACGLGGTDLPEGETF